MKKALVKAALALALVALLYGASAAYFMHEMTAPVSLDGSKDGAPVIASDSEAISKGILVKISEGMTARSVANMLHEKGIIRNARAFYAAARYERLGRMAGCPPLALEAGVYRLKSTMSVPQIFELLSSGRTENIRVTIPEGLTITKTAARLEKAGVCTALDFIAVCRDEKAASSRGLVGTTLEGYLFPDTYFFEPETTAARAADDMVQNFIAHVKTISNLDAMNKEDFYRTLILASIVEREYRVEDEAPLIASVFVNRIKEGMGLYSCATVEYIITEVEGRPHPEVIKYEDLKSDSPYNTYRWAALPPTPISSPGMVALHAAAEPAATDYYYFRLTDAEEGRHAFSKTFSGHIHEGTVYKTKKSG